MRPSPKLTVTLSALGLVTAAGCGEGMDPMSMTGGEPPAAPGPVVANCTPGGVLAAPANLPETLRAPDDSELYLRLRAEGTQIYTCQQNAAGAWAYTLKAPDARLIDDRCIEVGHHGAGPSWAITFDGSVVVGKKMAEAASPGTIPWLLLSGSSSSPGGMLSTVRFIQRVDTVGGVAPSDCDATRAGLEVAIPYTATYLYYRSQTPASASVSNPRS